MDRASQFSRAGCSRLVDVGEVAIPAVAVLGELFEEVVVEVFDSDADGDQAEGVGVVVVAGGFEDGEGVCGVDVGDAVGHEDDCSCRSRVLPTGLVGEPDAFVQSCLDVGAAAGPEAHDEVVDGRVIGARMFNEALHVVAEPGQWRCGPGHGGCSGWFRRLRGRC